MFGFIKMVVRETKESVRTIKYNPLNSLGQLIPVAMGLISFISFVVAYICFIAGGGYSEQIELIKAQGVDGTEEAFTYGTVNILSKGVVPTILNILFLLQIVVMIVTYMRHESKRMKILALVDLIVMGTAISAEGAFIILFGYVDFGKKIFANASTASTIRTTVRTVMVVFVVALIVFVILQVIARSRWMLGHSIGALLMSYVILPLLLLLLENIVPLVVAFVFVAIVAGVFAMMLLCCIGGGEPKKDKIEIHINGKTLTEKDFH